MTDSGPTSTLTTRFGGRYVLLDELGRGGMATVHRAHDEVLERSVAIKILHPQLATDPTFLDRFRREARAAAALNHPNVVTVYDWGEADGGAYLVLQLVEGTTLRSVLSSHGPLDAHEAATIVEAAAGGLDAAHSIGLVHRDVKPENVLLGIDGVVRITDFGLARAAATASTTFGTGVLVGSPHYVAPEAVRGEPLDPRADVYALGIVLFECLVGRPPHQGDTPYATALAHTERAVVPPSQLREGVDPALDEVVGWATAIDRDHRYADARDFARALANAVPGAVPLDHLVVTPPRSPAVPAADSQADLTAVVTSNGVHDDATTVLTPRRSRGWWGLVLSVALIAASAIGGFFLWEHVLAPISDVPHVIGSDEQEAAAALSQAGFVVEVSDTAVHDREIPAGHVVDQNPSDTARSGATVLLTLSAGPRMVDIPEVAGAGAESAREQLTDLQLRVTDSVDYHDTIAAGRAVTTDPEPGTEIAEGSEVTLFISDGPAPVTVPEFVGLDLADATALATEQRLRLMTVERQHDSAPANTVIAQSPDPASTVARDAVIDVVVSDGPPPSEVPSVRGQSVASATETLEELGFVVEVERRGGLGAIFRSGQVFDQDPGPGSMRPAGSTIIIYAYE